METAAAMVSFVGLVGTVAQGQKFLYDFTTNMKDCPKDIHDMRAEIESVEDLITQVIRQSKERDVRLRESAVLTRAIGHAQKGVEDLKKELAAYHVIGKRARLIFATKTSQTKKLRASLERTKTIMLDLQRQLHSDVLYDIRDDIRDMSQEVLKSMDNTSRDGGTHDRNFHKITQESKVQEETANNYRDREEASVPPANDPSSEDLTDAEIAAKNLEHVTDLLTETKISSSPNSIPSTPAWSREVSDISVTSSSQETTASSISSWQSLPPSISQNARKANIASKHPLLQFKDNQFQFLVAIIFTQRAKNQHLACQRATEYVVTTDTALLGYMEFLKEEAGG
ncbi:hypothetical protein COCMIDRAFT_96101 [Bipolaris oryzae ATCC 44560]|uniref:Fungal N-terminal domain-containing protein n=1 Tax=Bipolaris oryzae ATCC 44560 TaxID=930090 RepID=W6ZNT4_COCMI|nr:uncharacterized protein COCMIDRAFT_96101 [Bipolaris oryzae ATCC 44560]EUC45226.1 hypothetical protein COCMIDRAFT_96101 [Bipolaris oryzae ATCC 44560]